MLELGDLTQVAGHQEEEERSQTIGRDPKTEVGTPLPSAEVNNKKGSFWAGSVAGRRTIAILLRVEDERITETWGTRVLQASIKNRTKSNSPWKKKDSPVEPHRKIR